MKICKFKNVKILGISAFVPKKELNILDDKDLYNGDELRIKRVVESSGFFKRRVCETNIMTSDLCYSAALDVIKGTNIATESIDAILFLSYTPDYLMPATSYILHKKLNLRQDCIVMDIPQACSGFEIGLFQASMLINSGCKNVLLLVGDSFSKFKDMFKDHTAPVFGDAGTATIVSYDENADTSYFNIYSDGSNYDSLICENGGFKNPPTIQNFYEDGTFMYKSKMDGGRIFNFTLDKISPSILDLLNNSKTDKTDIDYYVMHQANKFILQNIARQINVLTEKIPMTTLSEYGNQCGASIPCTICDVLHDKVSSQKLRVLLSGFGVGLSWANALITIDNIYCSKILNYKE